MKLVSTLSAAAARRLRGLLFDLDDTLLDHGKLTEAAYAALFRLRESGLTLHAVTGRPAGWAELLVRLWPIQGAVAENGSIGVIAQAGKVTLVDPVPELERAASRRRLLELAAELTRTFPEFTAASDVGARRADFTFDIGELKVIPPARVDEAERWARARGLWVLRSSVHFHIGFDRCDKASGAIRLLSATEGVDPTRALFEYAFIGDSENDAACFGAFQTTIGVANLRGRATVAPRFVTAAARGAGFAEAAGVLCALRAGAKQ